MTYLLVFFGILSVLGIAYFFLVCLADNHEKLTILEARVDKLSANVIDLINCINYTKPETHKKPHRKQNVK